MTQSMTAFARTQARIDGMSFCWELRSVNHRYLEASFRLPDAWRFLETDLRTALRRPIQRGKVECLLKVTEEGQGQKGVVIDYERVDSLLQTATDLATSRNVPDDLRLSFLLGWPGVIQTATPDVELFAESVLQLFVDALNQLQQARTCEGQALATLIRQRLQALQERIVHARALVTGQAAQTREKLLTRLASLQVELDATRVEQEVALILTKMDVSEELDRLETHCREVDKALNSADAVGRRLDFLMQELNREANTLGSKSDTAGLTQCAVDMKVLIEQMREQIQNIE